jgi:flavin-dependent dehydrogenase
VFPGGYGGLVRSDGERVTLSCCIRRDELARCRRRYGGPGGGDAVLRHLESSCAGVRQTLRNARREGAWLSAGPIRPGIRRGYADGMFFVCNAAGEAHPIVAEGISMAMQSAWLLCGHLVRGQDEPLSSGDAARIGRAYEAAWVRQFAGRIHAAAAFAHIAMRPPAVALLLPLIRRLPSLLTLGAQLSGKVDRVVPIG